MRIDGNASQYNVHDGDRQETLIQNQSDKEFDLTYTPSFLSAIN